MECVHKSPTTTNVHQLRSYQMRPILISFSHIPSLPPWHVCIQISQSAGWSVCWSVRLPVCPSAIHPVPAKYICHALSFSKATIVKTSANVRLIRCSFLLSILSCLLYLSSEQQLETGHRTRHQVIVRDVRQWSIVRQWPVSAFSSSSSPGPDQ